MTALDAIGPHEVLARLPGADVAVRLAAPPCDSGSPEKADPETWRHAAEHLIPSNAAAEVAG